ncbi:hypothetical protein BH10ACT1_BH10ACT1_05910 [soil metagenome]
MSAPPDPRAIQALVQSLLERHRGGFVMALGDDGLAVDLPADLVLTTQRVAGGRSVLDIVERDHRHRVIDAWEQARSIGASRALVRLEGATGDTRVDLVDARPTHGTYLAFLAPLDGGDLPRTTSPAGSDTTAPPRVAVVRKDEVAVFVGIDEATTGMLGWTAEELVATRSLDLVHPDDHDAAIESWLDLLERPESQERVRLRYRTKAGSWRWLEVSNHNRLHDDVHRDVLAEMIDVTDEVHAVDALRASEELLRRLAATVPVGLAQVDLDGRITYANDRLAELVGPSTSQRLLDRFATADATDAGRVAEALASALVGGRDGVVECRFAPVEPGADPVRATVDVRALTDDDGSPTGAIICVSDVTESVRMRNDLAERALRDPLTGGHNRPGLFAALSDLLGQPGRHTAVLFADLDGFKAVNDALGHQVGDEVLRVASRRLVHAMRDGDTIGRLGGDEFVVLCPDASTDPAALADLARRAHDALAAPMSIGGVAVSLSASVGLAHAAGGIGMEPARAIAAADSAMYEAKHARRAGDDVLPVVTEA